MTKLGKQKRVSDKMIEEAIVRANGNMSAAARALGYQTRQLYNRITKERREELRADIEEKILDAAESVVHKKLSEGDGATARWLLDRKGEDRGYGVKREVTHKGALTLAAIKPEDAQAAKKLFEDDGEY